MTVGDLNERYGEEKRCDLKNGEKDRKERKIMIVDWGLEREKENSAKKRRKRPLERKKKIESRMKKERLK